MMHNGQVPLTFDTHIKRKLSQHLDAIGFRNHADGGIRPPSITKNRVRLMHRFQRLERLRAEGEFIADAWPRLREYFADGADVDPVKISPRLELIKAGTWQSELFRLAALTWSVPVSQGFGRRLRFLVWDQWNKKLIGLIALGDPVFNMKVRDQEIGWAVRDREERLVNVLDAYVLGAVPPYNVLLGGKLVASLLRTKEVCRAFARKYGSSRGIISRRRKHPSLTVISTTSALGRSSVYNRLAINGTNYLRSVGYTSGWGHFHISPELFELLRKFLSARDDNYAKNNRFGDGPNWKMRAIRKAFHLLGIDENLLRHRIGREVFLCFLADNAKEFLCGREKHPQFKTLQCVSEVAAQALTRWVIPRAERLPEFRSWRKRDLRRRLMVKTQRTRKQNDTGQFRLGRVASEGRSRL
jgi:Domain of unknown function (DUF4338)